jgi:hypothetical protein
MSFIFFGKSSSPAQGAILEYDLCEHAKVYTIQGKQKIDPLWPITLIFKNLDFETLLQARLVCSKWNKIIGEYKEWKLIRIRSFNTSQKLYLKKILRFIIDQSKRMYHPLLPLTKIYNQIISNDSKLRNYHLIFRNQLNIIHLSFYINIKENEIMELVSMSDFIAHYQITEIKVDEKIVTETKVNEKINKIGKRLQSPPFSEIQLREVVLESNGQNKSQLIEKHRLDEVIELAIDIINAKVSHPIDPHLKRLKNSKNFSSLWQIIAAVFT